MTKEKTVIERSVLIKEIETLSPLYYGEVIDFVGYLKSKKNAAAIALEKAAEMAAEEYRTNNELTAFSALDSEDFYEAR